jgi:hypothetical protein
MGLAALLAVLLVVPTLRAADPEKSDVQDLQKQLQDIRKKLDDLRTVRDLERAMDSVTFQMIEKRLQHLEDSLARMSNPTRVTSGFPPEVGATGTGTLRLHNRSAVGATVVINGQPYTVQPNETKVIPNMPAGPFTYEVSADGFGLILPRVNRTLIANRVFTININPSAE